MVAEPVAVLGTMRPDGPPRLVPFTFAPIEEFVIVSAVDSKPKTARRLARLADIERDPRVTVLAHHYEDDWDGLWWVRADGRAAIHDDPPAGADALIVRYTQYRVQPPPGPWIVITLEHLTGWSAQGGPLG